MLEPRDVWERYLEDKHKPRAIRIEEDPQGKEYMEIVRAAVKIPAREAAQHNRRNGRDAPQSAPAAY